MKRARNGAHGVARILVGETYVERDTGRLVRITDARTRGEVVVESVDAPVGERWRCDPHRLAPAARGAERCIQFATIPRRLLIRGERLASQGDRLGAAGAFASAALALEALAGELREPPGEEANRRIEGERHDPS
jgi:hypothetical protein